ncbi:MAG: cation:proton antiporter [Halobacteriales archaeon]|nr:cation:proton antiporter [Halobacteriales archaeon]
MADPLLFQAGVVFTILAVAGAVAWRAGLSVIPAYLLAGILVGPHAPEVAGLSLSIVERTEFIDLFAELGVVFLLFFIGVEFSVGTMLADPGRIARAGGLDLVVNVGLGLLLGLAVGFSPLEALFLAGIVYPSSSAVITKTLVDLGWIADPESEAIIGVLVVEDVVMAIYLAVLAAVALGGPAASLALPLAESFGLLVAFVLLATVGGPFVERLFETRSDELFLLRVVGLTALLAGFALLTGVSEAVAAFFVGAAISESDLKPRLEHVLAPARNLFAAVFFFAIGLDTDPVAVAGVGGLLVAGVVVTAAGKLASGYLGGRAYRLEPPAVGPGGARPRHAGEFSLVVAALAVTTPAVSPAIGAFAVGYVLVMSLLGTLLMGASGRIEGALGLVPRV